MFGDKVKECRKRINMSQEELALKVGYKGRSSIAKIETNIADVPQEKVVLISKALNVPISLLMEDELNNKKNDNDQIIKLIVDLNLNKDQLNEVYEYAKYVKEHK